MTPEQALAQRRNALTRANKIRTTNSRIKADLQAGRLTFAKALHMDTVQSLQIIQLLLAVRGVGKRKASHAISRLGISPSKRVGSLSDRQKRELVAWSRRYSGATSMSTEQTPRTPINPEEAVMTAETQKPGHKMSNVELAKATAPPATYRLDELCEKLRRGGFPGTAKRLGNGKIGPSEAMWAVADKLLNDALVRTAEDAAGGYSADLADELGIERRQ